MPSSTSLNGSGVSMSAAIEGRAGKTEDFLKVDRQSDVESSNAARQLRIIIYRRTLRSFNSPLLGLDSSSCTFSSSFVPAIVSPTRVPACALTSIALSFANYWPANP